MTNETKPPSQLVRQKKRRRGNTAGRRIRPETDAPQSMTADELHEIERRFARLPDLEPVLRTEADTVVRLVGEVRRLRAELERLKAKAHR